MKKLILPLLITLLAIPSLSMAAGPGPGPGKGGYGPHFAQMDSNGDGVVTAEEHAAEAARRFAEMDANGDGKLTREEIRAHHNKMREKWRKDCPVNKNCPAGKDCPMNSDCPAWKDCPMNKGT